MYKRGREVELGASEKKTLAAVRTRPETGTFGFQVPRPHQSTMGPNTHIRRILLDLKIFYRKLPKVFPPSIPYSSLFSIPEKEILSYIEAESCRPCSRSIKGQDETSCGGVKSKTVPNK